MRAARAAQPGWAAATAYNRGQVLYRLAEMVEARISEFAELCSGRDEVERAIDRVVWYAGWADKLPQVLGGSNPVAGPYFNFTDPGADRRRRGPRARTSRRCSVSSRACCRRSSAATPSSPSRPRRGPLAAIELAEAIATSDLPGGVVNLLTGFRAELAPVLASHMDVNALDLCGADGAAAELEQLAAENVKRVVHGRCRRPEPVGDRELPRAQDRLAPDRPVTARYATGAGMAQRRFSHAIAEGDGISVIAAVEDPDSATRRRGATRRGARRARRPGAPARRRRSLPILWRADVSLERASASADAYLLVFDALDDDDGRLEELHAQALELGLDCAVEVRDEEELEQALDRVDPEIFLLSPVEARRRRDAARDRARPARRRARRQARHRRSAADDPRRGAGARARRLRRGDRRTATNVSPLVGAAAALTSRALPCAP